MRQYSWFSKSSSLQFLLKNFAKFSAFLVIFLHIFGFFGEKVDPTETRAAFLGSTRGPQRGQKADQEAPRADFGRIFEAETVRKLIFYATSMKKLISQKSLFCLSKSMVFEGSATPQIDIFWYFCWFSDFFCKFCKKKH